MEKSKTGPTYPFRIRYITLPAAVLLISVILVLIFYTRLPDTVAYRFLADGSPWKYVSRSTVLLWMLGPQFLFALAAALVAGSIIRMANRFIEPDTAIINPERIILLMGNMPAMPQAIFLFAMLDIFSYNSYQVHLPPVWIFAVVIMVLGGIIISTFSFRAIRLVWKSNKE